MIEHMGPLWWLRVIRVVWYLALLLLFPLTVVGVWWLLEFLFDFSNVLAFLLISQSIVALFFIWIISGKLTDRIPSEREIAMKRALHSKDKFILLYERSPVPYCILDSTGRIVMYNLAAVRLFESDTEKLLGTPLLERILHDDEALLQTIKTGLQHTRPLVDVEVQVETDEKHIRWVTLSSFLYERDSEYLVSLMDITHRKEVDAAKSEFVALATHQLRTPIAAIRWNVELLTKSVRDIATEKHHAYLQKIERNVLRMNDLINDFLNVSKLEMGTFATESESVDLEAFCRSVTDEFAEIVASKTITLNEQYDPAARAMHTDPRLLHIIVSNLVSNAVKYTPEQGTVTVRYALDDGTVTFVVSDTGIGIPEEEVPTLFTKFFRASNAQLHQTQGTGLGLYVVRQSAEMLGGTIEVETKENNGTTFTVRLPYQAAA